MKKNKKNNSPSNILDTNSSNNVFNVKQISNKGWFVFFWLGIIYCFVILREYNLLVKKEGFDNINEITKMQCSTYIISMIICTILFFSCYRTEQRTRSRFFYMIMCLILMTSMFLQGLSTLYDGNPAYQNLLLLLVNANYFSDFLLQITVWFFIQYTYSYYLKRVKIFDIILISLTFIQTALLVVNYKYKIIFVIEDGVCKEVSYSIVIILSIIIMAILLFVSTIKVKAKFSERFVLALFVLVPLAVNINIIEQDQGDVFIYPIYTCLLVISFASILVLTEQEAYNQQILFAATTNDLLLASRIQTSMLPLNFDDYVDLGLDINASMEPAREVGGDFYDFFKLDENRVVVLVGDVSGKGIPASIFMSITKVLIFKEIDDKKSLPEAISSVHKTLVKNNKEDMFITLWAGMIDLKNNTLHYVNAGHNKPYIKRKDGECIKLAERHGPILGMTLVPNAVYSQSVTSFNEGDLLYVYTDGVSEANSNESDLFGEERIENMLRENVITSSKQFNDMVKNNIYEFVGDAEQFDDITMLCVIHK